MPPITYDTSVFISYRPEEFPSGFLFSAVALQELIASARDDSEKDRWVVASLAYEKEDRLIVPNSDDWLLASKVLFWLMQQRKKKAGGKLPRLKPGASQRMALDALMAISARRCKAEIITVNWSDFDAIRYYCSFKLTKASDHFKR
jgi:hypothetical protein